MPRPRRRAEQRPPARPRARFPCERSAHRPRSDRRYGPGEPFHASPRRSAQSPHERCAAIRLPSDRCGLEYGSDRATVSGAELRRDIQRGSVTTTAAKPWSGTFTDRRRFPPPPKATSTGVLPGGDGQAGDEHAVGSIVQERVSGRSRATSVDSKRMRARHRAASSAAFRRAHAFRHAARAAMRVSAEATIFGFASWYS